VARIRGRHTGTRRPPRLTDPAPWPWRVAPSVGVVATLRPAHRGHVGLHHRGHHLQPGAHGQGQQPLLHFAGQLGQRHADPLGHDGRARFAVGLLVVLLHGGPLPRGVLGGSPEYLPQGRTQVGDRHLNFHESRDNLGIDPLT
jgi:hypothetical protein